MSSTDQVAGRAIPRESALSATVSYLGGCETLYSYFTRQDLQVVNLCGIGIEGLRSDDRPLRCPRKRLGRIGDQDHFFENSRICRRNAIGFFDDRPTERRRE